MRSRTPRRTRLVVLAAATVLSTAACGTTDPTAAVLLGDDRVSLATLEQQVTAQLAVAGPDAAANREELQRDVLNRLVLGRLLDRTAADEGVTVSDAAVDDVLRDLTGVESTQEAYDVAQEQAGLDRQAASAFARVQAVSTALATRFGGEPDEAQLRAAYEASLGEYDTVSVRVFPLADPALAEATVADINADPGRFAEIAAERSSEPSAAEAAPEQVGRGTQPAEVDAALFGTPAGQATVVQGSSGPLVVLVVERTTVPFEDAATQLREQVAAEQGQAAVAERLASEAEEVGIIVNPRFGRWDPEQLQVVADEPSTSRPAETDGAADELLPEGGGTTGGSTTGEEPPAG